MNVAQQNSQWSWSQLGRGGTYRLHTKVGPRRYFSWFVSRQSFSSSISLSFFYPHIQFYFLRSILPSRKIRQRVPSGAIQPQCGGIGGGWSRLGCNDSSVAGLYQAPRGPPTGGCPLHTQPGPGHSSGHDGTLGTGYAGLASAETAPPAAASTATVGRRGVGWSLGRHDAHLCRKPDIPLARLQSREEHGAKSFQQPQLL